jgi:hypothetical protein
MHVQQRDSKEYKHYNQPTASQVICYHKLPNLVHLPKRTLSVPTGFNFIRDREIVKESYLYPQGDSDGSEQKTVEPRNGSHQPRSTRALGPAKPAAPPAGPASAATAAARGTALPKHTGSQTSREAKHEGTRIWGAPARAGSGRALREGGGGGAAGWLAGFADDGGFGGSAALDGTETAEASPRRLRLRSEWVFQPDSRTQGLDGTRVLP